MDVGDGGDLVVVIRWSSATGGGWGDIGEGGSIRAAAVRASSARMADARCSSSRSAVAARTRARAASYFFFMVVATMVLSFYRNSATSAAWLASSVAIGGGVMVRLPEM
jgi:hypothetical protein